MIEYLGLMATCIAIFGAFDLLTTVKQKDSISNYIFGFHDILGEKFELVVIRALLGVMITDGRLKKTRVLIFSLMSGFLFMIFLFIFLEQLTGEGRAEFAGVTVPELYRESDVAIYLLTFCSMGLLIGFFTALYDYYSFKVSIWLFLKNSPTGIKYFAAWVLDTIATFTPIFVIMYFTNEAMDLDGIINYDIFSVDFFLAPLLLLAFGAYFSGALMAVIQMIIICLGWLIRLVLKITKLNTYIAINSNILAYPFTFIGIVAGGLLVAIL